MRAKARAKPPSEASIPLVETTKAATAVENKEPIIDILKLTQLLKSQLCQVEALKASMRVFILVSNTDVLAKALIVLKP